jgi:hypothetical protein
MDVSISSHHPVNHLRCLPCYLFKFEEISLIYIMCYESLTLMPHPLICDIAWEMLNIIFKVYINLYLDLKQGRM